MHQLFIRQIWTTVDNIVDPDPDWSKRTVRVWQCIELNFIPQLNARLKGSIYDGVVTNVEHSFTTTGISTHTIDLTDMEPHKHQLTQLDIQMLVAKINKSFPHSFNGEYILEMWD